MSGRDEALRAAAEEIWWAGVRAVDPARLIRQYVAYDPPRLRLGTVHIDLPSTARVIVVGAGKASAAMAVAVEEQLRELVESGRVTGWVNVPADQCRATTAIRLHPARPPGKNEPTEEGVRGAEEIERLVQAAREADVVLCLISGGGSALLPAPAAGVSLEDKQLVTALLHRAGATIDEMNCVRKHLSRLKGGGLVRLCRSRCLVSLILSDVVGDPLDVIASGPTAPDPTTYDDAIEVLRRYRLWDQVPAAVRNHLEAGARGERAETLKELPPWVHNLVIGNNRTALDAAAEAAASRGYSVVDLGAFVEGETQEVARAFAGIVLSVLRDERPAAPPVAILSGGETTVRLPEDHGQGGRNQEFVVAMAVHLARHGLERLALLAAGTDGEDGPTDAAGGVMTQSVWQRAVELGLDARAALQRHDTYAWLQAAGGLFVTGPTATNVTDLRVFLVAPSA